jgi:hypothetical protein
LYGSPHCTPNFADSADSEKVNSPEAGKQMTGMEKMKEAIQNMEKFAQTVKKESLSGNSSFHTYLLGYGDNVRNLGYIKLVFLFITLF